VQSGERAGTIYNTPSSLFFFFTPQIYQQISNTVKMSVVLSFRVAAPADAPLLQPLVQSAYRGDSSRLGWTTEAELLAGERIDVAGIAAKITAPGSAVLMATDADGVLVGCCEVLKRSANVAYFGMFAIDPLRQAGGLGRQVLAYAERYCEEQWGTQKLEMNVIWVRKELISWYQRRGYRVTGERKEFPYHELKDEGLALKDDLHFEVLEKVLGVEAKVEEVTVVTEVTEVAA